jgi:endoglucanase
MGTMNRSSCLRWLAFLTGCAFACSLSTAESTGGAAGPAAGAAPGRAFTFKRGVNLSHWLSQNTDTLTYAAPWFGERDVAWIAEQGFDHIRLPVDGRLCLNPDGSLDEAKLTPVDDTVRWARARGLGVVLDMHFLPGADFNRGGEGRVFEDPALREKVADFWRRLARRFANQGPWLRFEILNEPVAPTSQQLNLFNRRMLAAIRQSNPARIVYLSSNRWSTFGTVDDLEVPADPNIAITVHYYEPMVFTHQRAPWAGFTDTMPAVPFPGRVPDLSGATADNHPLNVRTGDELTVANIEAGFSKVAAWASLHASGREIYLGEFGVYKAADPASKRRWISAVRAASESRGWSWAVWDYNDSFGVRDAQGQATPILQGLFPR